MRKTQMKAKSSWKNGKKMKTYIWADLIVWMGIYKSNYSQARPSCSGEPIQKTWVNLFNNPCFILIITCFSFDKMHVCMITFNSLYAIWYNHSTPLTFLNVLLSGARIFFSRTQGKNVKKQTNKQRKYMITTLWYTPIPNGQYLTYFSEGK